MGRMKNRRQNVDEHMRHQRVQAVEILCSSRSFSRPLFTLAVYARTTTESKVHCSKIPSGILSSIIKYSFLFHFEKFQGFNDREK